MDKGLFLENFIIVSFLPSFYTNQTLGATNIVNAYDNSTGSDVAITQRRLYFQQADGTFLVPSGTTTNYVEWPILSNPLAINLLTQDAALLVICNWCDVNGTVLYTESQLYCYTNNGESFLYQLTQGQASNPALLNDTNYLQNKYLVRVYIDSANNAVLFGLDISAAANCISAYTAMIANQNDLF